MRKQKLLYLEAGEEYLITGENINFQGTYLVDEESRNKSFNFNISKKGRIKLNFWGETVEHTPDKIVVSTGIIYKTDKHEIITIERVKP